VSPATLVSIAITPNPASIALGLTLQLTATGTFTDHSKKDLTTQVTWASGTPATAKVSNASTDAGLATSLAKGTTMITAAKDGVTGSVTLTVTAAALVSIEVSPTNPHVALGLQQQLRQRLHAHEADHKDASEHKSKQGKQVEDAAQPLPALALWVVEDLLVHREIRATRRMRLRSIVCRRMVRVNARRRGLCVSAV